MIRTLPKIVVLSITLFSLYCVPTSVWAATPAAWWNFDEPSGVVFDITDNGNNGVLKNGATRFVGAQAGNKLLLDGENDYMEVADSSETDFSISDFSFTFWVFFNELPDEAVPILSKQDSSKAGYVIFLNPDHQVSIQARDTSASVRYAEFGETPLKENTWYHIAAVGDRSGGYRLYVNGVQESTERLNILSNQNGSINTDTSLIVGGSLETDKFMAGRIDDLRIYETALTTMEVEEIYGHDTDDKETSSGMRVGTYYMPAWRQGTFFGFDAVQDHPERKSFLGYYDEGEPNVADQHIKAALNHGVSFFIYNWFRCTDCPKDPNPITVDSLRLGQALHDGFMKSRYTDDMDFAIMISGTEFNRTVYSLNDVKDNLMPFLIKEYFKHPSYLMVDGKPVLFIFKYAELADELGGASKLPQMLEIMRDEVKAAGFPGLHLVFSGPLMADYGYTRPGYAADVYDDGFDYVVPYFSYIPGSPSTNKAVSEQEKYLNHIKNSGVPYLPFAGTGWDNVLPGAGGTRWRLTPSAYEGLLKTVKEQAQKAPVGSLTQKLFIADAWNETHEGHYLEPDQEYGYGFLEAIADVFPDQVVDSGLASPRGGPFDTLYKAHLASVKNKRLVAYYPFDTGAKDETKSNAHGRTYGDPRLAGGKFGKAYRFDGVNDMVQITSNYNMYRPNTLTVAAWVNSDSAGKLTTPLSQSQTFQFAFNKNGSGHCTIAAENDITWYRPGTTANWGPDTIKPGTWQHVACVYDGRGTSAYVDGVEVGRTTVAMSGPVYGTGGHINIGRAAGNSVSYYKGLIDEVKIWNYALSPEAILAEATALEATEPDEGNIPEEKPKPTPPAKDDDTNITPPLPDDGFDIKPPATDGDTKRGDGTDGGGSGRSSGDVDSGLRISLDSIPAVCRIFVRSDLAESKDDSTTFGTISLLQSFLRSTGDYTYPEITGYFGPATAEALKNWQKRNRVIAINGYGTYGPLTRVAFGRLCINALSGKTNDVHLPSQKTTVTQTHIFNRNLWLGVSGTDVVKLQEYLRSTGDYTYPEITGYYGNATAAAVMRYQCRLGIVCSGDAVSTGYGVVGPATRKAINQT